MHNDIRLTFQTLQQILESRYNNAIYIIIGHVPFYMNIVILVSIWFMENVSFTRVQKKKVLICYYCYMYPSESKFIMFHSRSIHVTHLSHPGTQLRWSHETSPGHCAPALNYHKP